LPHDMHDPNFWENSNPFHFVTPKILTENLMQIPHQENRIKNQCCNAWWPGNLYAYSTMHCTFNFNMDEILYSSHRVLLWPECCCMSWWNHWLCVLLASCLLPSVICCSWMYVWLWLLIAMRYHINS
jgi:hypothetical protein